ncbi:30S ribosomal protein S1 [Desulfopila inferna]|uniref:30S ribosomal protein S1 n=1 Tax=Desulfopila inferna TaxID=468528 RepID=UPI00196689CB|nr:30S ribosomal protein S1 [Desulfopila inferna]MBM9605225.1 30S ribosomal protein S1 [Desulfopila inferna]
MENFSDSFEELFKSEESRNLKKLSPGEKVKAVVAGVSGENIFLDVGGKSEGILEAAELTDEEGNITVQPGDTVEVYFLQAKKSEQVFTTRLGSGASLAHLEEAWRNHIPVEGYVKAEIKGGFEITLSGNARAFCPYSQMGLRRVEDAAAAYLDTRMTFLITRFEENGRNLVVSARAVQEEERERQKAALRETLEEGQIVQATITSIRDFGAFADIGGVDGLIPISEVGWSRVENIDDHFSVGQQVNVMIKSIDWEKDRISLSLKETLEDPWDNFIKNFPVGSKIQAKVSRLAQFGAFVTLVEGVDGLLHISKLGGGRRINHPREVLEEGQDIEVIIEGIDEDEKRISLTPSDYQTPEDEAEIERQEYTKYKAGSKKNDADTGSLGALLKAKLEEKKK